MDDPHCHGSQTRVGSTAKIGPRTDFTLLVSMSGLPFLVYLLLILVSRFLFLPGWQPGLLDTLISICF